jgi:hypothetical protein
VTRVLVLLVSGSFGDKCGRVARRRHDLSSFEIWGVYEFSALREAGLLGFDHNWHTSGFPLSLSCKKPCCARRAKDGVFVFCFSFSA